MQIVYFTTQGTGGFYLSGKLNKLDPSYLSDCNWIVPGSEEELDMLSHVNFACLNGFWRWKLWGDRDWSGPFETREEAVTAFSEWASNQYWESKNLENSQFE